VFNLAWCETLIEKLHLAVSSVWNKFAWCETFVWNICMKQVGVLPKSSLKMQIHFSNIHL